MKKIISAFFTSHPDSVGNAYRINRLKSIAEKFNLTIVTNYPNFIIENIPDCNTINIRLFSKGKFSNLLFSIKAGFKLLKIEHDLLYYFHNDSPISFFSNKLKICEIHQSHEIIGIGKNDEKGLNVSIKQLIKYLYSIIIICGLKKADYCFAVSNQLLEFFIKKGLKRKKIEYLPHGVDLKLFDPDHTENSRLLQHIPKDSFVMIYTGWVSENRGLYIMLNGLCRLKSEVNKIHLVIVGAEDSYIKKINLFVSEKNIKKNITILGRLEYKEIPGIIKRANVCLSFLEMNESYSMSPPQKIFEYFAMGKPVIANNLPTHTDYIVNHKMGLIIDYSIKDFIKAIMFMYHNENVAKKINFYCIKEAKKYSIDIINNRLKNEINNRIGSR